MRVGGSITLLNWPRLVMQYLSALSASMSLVCMSARVTRVCTWHVTDKYKGKANSDVKNAKRVISE